jgi:hypothetical protein
MNYVISTYPKHLAPKNCLFFILIKLYIVKKNQVVSSFLLLYSIHPLLVLNKWKNKSRFKHLIFEFSVSFFYDLWVFVIGYFLLNLTFWLMMVKYTPTCFVTLFISIFISDSILQVWFFQPQVLKTLHKSFVWKILKWTYSKFSWIFAYSHIYIYICMIWNFWQVSTILSWVVA